MKIWPLFGLLLLSMASCQTANQAQQTKLNDGFNQYTQRKFDLSEQAADEFIRKTPNDPSIDEAYYLRGISRLGREDKKGASQDLKNAISKSNRSDLKAKAHRALGDLAFDEQNWSEAVKQYQSAIKYLPTEKLMPIVVFRVGSALQAQGKWSESKQYFQQVLTLNAETFWKERATARMKADSYSLQFGAFRDTTNAAQTARSLRQQGLDPVIVNEVRDGQLLLMVRCGEFNTYNEADDARSKLLAKNPLVTIVP